MVRFGYGFSKVLQNIFWKESLMHHCVFTNNYYARPESLILTAQIGEQHIETIEVSLETFQIVQSRGVCNRPTAYHDRIISLVEQNMEQIRRCASA